MQFWYNPLFLTYKTCTMFHQNLSLRYWDRSQKSRHTYTEIKFGGLSTLNGGGIFIETKTYFLCSICREDGSRVIHTDGSSNIALGSRDRKVRFIDCESGKEQGPVITGHAGSVRCVHLCSDKKTVFSGSYDTSIRYGYQSLLLSFLLLTEQCLI